MAIALSGVITTEQVEDIMIEKLRKILVSQWAFRVHSQDKTRGKASIKIPQIEDFDTQDYDGNDLTITDATDTSVVLPFDQQKAFAKTVDQCDEAETALDVVAEVLDNGAYAIAKAIDTYNNALIGTNAGVPVIPTVAVDELNAISIILKMGQTLDEQDAPAEGRIAIVSPAFATALAEANTNLNTSSAEEATRTGFVGQFGGFTIYKSNNLADGATTGKWCYAGVSTGADYGEQINKTSIVDEMEKNFKALIKGLAKFGAVVSQPQYYVRQDITSA